VALFLYKLNIPGSIELQLSMDRFYLHAFLHGLWHECFITIIANFFMNLSVKQSK